eukprot:TRINITY_DN64617_c0_g1_i1.p1 TRINITY_DN64617_c0_g1~~TRINITY_DN64617_c0_g1_i1.p1  ORF type:complete len:272 (+),score=51.42 TRINITY_DN64617_c0_g1_i1:66-818(+)
MASGYLADNSGGYGGGGGAGGYDRFDQDVPPAGRQQKTSQGVAFQTDFAAGRSTTNIFSASSVSPEEEERRLITKVFDLIDTDNSGNIDIKELEGMFKIFDVQTEFLSGAMQRIMATADKDQDGTISASEFHGLLSAKFEKGDSRKDIESVFNRMDKNRDGKLDQEELMAVAKMLGETPSRSDVKDMIKTFSLDYQKRMKDWNSKRGDQKAGQRPPAEPTFLTVEDFYEVMQTELPLTSRNAGVMPQVGP